MRLLSRLVLTPGLLVAGWHCRVQGADGLGMWDHAGRRLRLIHSIARERDGEVWAHLSVTQESGRIVSWEQLRFAKEAVYPEKAALQVLAPLSEWYTLDAPDAAEVMNLYVCLTARPTPDFRSSDGAL